MPRLAADAAQAEPRASLIRAAAHTLAALGMRPAETFIFSTIGVAMLLFAVVLWLAAWAANPQAFEWGRRFLGVERMLWGTALLLAGGIAMTLAVGLALRKHRGLLRVSLVFSMLAGAGFLGVLALDYDAKIYRGLVPGSGFLPNERYVARKFKVNLSQNTATDLVAMPMLDAMLAPRTVDPANGARLFANTCASCHGMQGEGMPGQGLNLRVSEFVRNCDDEKLLKFIIAGRQPWDPANTTKVAMPGRGGNPMFKDDDLRDIAAFVRNLQKQGADQHTGDMAANAGLGETPRAFNGVDAQINGGSGAPKSLSKTVIHRWVVPPPPAGPEGLNRDYLGELGRPAWKPPKNTQRYFGAYFAATGIQACFVLAATLLSAVLFGGSMRARVGPPLVGPIFLGGVLWWWAVGAWLILLPLICFCF